jgi:DNA-binding beta-propeller fold protein YncE
MQDAPIKGTFSLKFGSRGSGKGQFNYPYFLASSADDLFVAGGNDNHRVDIFSVKGEFKVSIGGPNQGHSDGLFEYPDGVHVHGDELFVSDSFRADVQVFSVNKERKFLCKFGKGHLSYPQGLCVVGDSEVWVSDSGLHQVVVFDIKTGQLLKTIGSTEGSGDEQFDDPSDVCVVGEEVFVCDGNNERLQVLSKAGKFVRRIGSAGQFDYPTGLCFHAGEVYVSDYSGDRIVVVDPASGKTLRTFGKQGTGDGEFNGPYGVAVLQGQLFVSDERNCRIQSFV